MEPWVNTGTLILPEAVARKRLKPKPTAIDLFCGCGGMSLGFIQAGYEVVCAVDNDPMAVVTYLANLGQWPIPIHFTDTEAHDTFETYLQKHMDATAKRSEHGLATLPMPGSHRPADRTPVRSFIFGDVRKVTGEMLAEVSGEDVVDVLAGSPPCQGFSQAGKRRIRDDRNALLFEMARIVCEARPNTMVMENVPGIMSMVTAEGMPVVDQFTRILEEGSYAGYDALRKMFAANPDYMGAMKDGVVGQKAKPKAKPTKAAKKAEVEAAHAVGQASLL